VVRTAGKVSKVRSQGMGVREKRSFVLYTAGDSSTRVIPRASAAWKETKDTDRKSGPTKRVEGTEGRVACLKVVLDGKEEKVSSDAKLVRDLPVAPTSSQVPIGSNAWLWGKFWLWPAAELRRAGVASYDVGPNLSPAGCSWMDVLSNIMSTATRSTFAFAAPFG
jgi:hypothetical protein